MDIKRSLFIFVTLVASQIVMASHLWIEAESFENKGGWVVEPTVYGLDGLSLSDGSRNGYTG